MFFITVYAGAGLIANDRRANALQIYLSKPLTRVEYIFGKLAILATFLLLVTWVPAIVLLLRADHVRRQLHVLAAQPVSASGDHAVLVRSRSTTVGARDARAVVAVEQQPLRRRSSTRR